MNAYNDNDIIINYANKYEYFKSVYWARNPVTLGSQGGVIYKQKRT